jgi:hypothetical protein
MPRGLLKQFHIQIRPCMVLYYEDRPLAKAQQDHELPEVAARSRGFYAG